MRHMAMVLRLGSGKASWLARHVPRCLSFRELLFDRRRAGSDYAVTRRRELESCADDGLAKRLFSDGGGHWLWIAYPVCNLPPGHRSKFSVFAMLIIHMTRLGPLDALDGAYLIVIMLLIRT